MSDETRTITFCRNCYKAYNHNQKFCFRLSHLSASRQALGSRMTCTPANRWHFWLHDCQDNCRKCIYFHFLRSCMPVTSKSGIRCTIGQILYLHIIGKYILVDLQNWCQSAQVVIFTLGNFIWWVPYKLCGTKLVSNKMPSRIFSWSDCLLISLANIDIFFLKY